MSPTRCYVLSYCPPQSLAVVFLTVLAVNLRLRETLLAFATGEYCMGREGEG